MSLEQLAISALSFQFSSLCCLLLTYLCHIVFQALKFVSATVLQQPHFKVTVSDEACLLRTCVCVCVPSSGNHTFPLEKHPRRTQSNHSSGTTAANLT